MIFRMSFRMSFKSWDFKGASKKDFEWDNKLYLK